MKTYKTIESWTKAMQKDKNKKLHADWYNIAGHWYTCEEFDCSGKYMRYTSVTAWQHIDIETSNRYSDMWLSDMVATVYPIEDLRFDITYYIDKDTSKKDLMELITYRPLDNKQLKSLLEFVINK